MTPEQIGQQWHDTVTGIIDAAAAEMRRAACGCEWTRTDLPASIRCGCATGHHCYDETCRPNHGRL